MKTPFLGKPCPMDEKLACIECGWFIKTKHSCKLGYKRVCPEPMKHRGRDEEYDTEW